MSARVAAGALVCALVLLVAGVPPALSTATPSVGSTLGVPTPKVAPTRRPTPRDNHTHTNKQWGAT
jgi:hypothetical protein